MARVFGDIGAFSVAIFGGGQHRLLLVFGDQHGDDGLAIVQHHAANATCVAAHRPHIVFIETHALAAVAEQHHVMRAIGERGADQEVAGIQVHRDDASLARVGELIERGLLDRAHAGGHEDVLRGGKAAFFTRERQHHGDFFAFDQREHVDDGPSARTARALRHFPHLEPIQSASV